MTGLSAFFHKNHRPQQIARDPKWTDLKFRDGDMLNRKRFTAPRSGILQTKLYLPVRFTLRGPSAILRVRLVREPFKGDPLNPTAYDEKPLLPTSDGYARVSFPNPLATEAQKGRRYRWQAQVVGDADVVTTGTHYALWKVIP